MEKEGLYSGPISELFHKKREALRSKLYKVPWGPADQTVSEYLRLDNEIEKVEKKRD